MSNFYTDNADIEKTLDAVDLSEVAELCEEGFRFAKEYDFAPTSSEEAIDNYKRALSVCGDIIGNRIAPTAEETDRVGNILNEDGTVTYA
ncbi:MAG: acyl-CoA dehydrogenase, partial [Kiritimatiellae bacterium]|nr:acyl-CoA dehydrogenase [Kiritimatiellia bacterium]